ncbi:MAG: hypothetical protein FWC80_02545 [Firmicutes bacterium]|nr:hypothetical protein [Bacillota bacterium]
MNQKSKKLISLQYKILSKKQLIAIVLGIFFLAITLLIAPIVLMWLFFDDFGITHVIITISISVGIVLSIIVCFIIWGIRREIKFNKKVSLWLQDAVELKAYSRKANSNPDFGYPFFINFFLLIFYAIFGVPIEIELILFYNGKKQVKASGPKRYDKYRRVFQKYSDRIVSVLYSPTYDEVLLLMDAKENGGDVKTYDEYLEETGYVDEFRSAVSKLAIESANKKVESNPWDKYI